MNRWAATVLFMNEEDYASIDDWLTDVLPGLVLEESRPRPSCGPLGAEDDRVWKMETPNGEIRIQCGVNTRHNEKTYGLQITVEPLDDLPTAREIAGKLVERGLKPALGRPPFEPWDDLG